MKIQLTAFGFVRSGSALLMASVLLQALAIVRTVQLTSAHGASSSLDAFYIANTYSVAVFNVAAAAITMVLVPEFVRGVDRQLVRQYTSHLYRGAFAASLLVLVVYASLSLMNRSDANADYPPVLLLGVLLAFQQVRIAGAVATGRLQSQGLFAVPRYLAVFPAVAPVVSLLITPDLLIMCVALGCGFIAEALGTVVYGRRHPPQPPTLSIAPQPHLTRATMPVLVSSGLFQIQVALFVTVMAAFGTGYATLYSNASQLVGSIHSILLGNITLLLYPRISRWVATSDARIVPRLSFLVETTNHVIFYLILAYLIAGKSVLQFVFARGQFTISAVDTLFVYGLVLLTVLPLGVLRDYLYRLLYASRHGKLASTNSVLVIAVSLVVLGASAPWLGPWSVMVALIAASVTSAIGALWRVRAVGYLMPAATSFATLAVQFLAVAGSLGASRLVSHVSGLSGWLDSLTQFAVASALYVTYAAASSLRGWRAANDRSS